MEDNTSPSKALRPYRSPVRALGAALFDTGLRVREEYDELILDQRDYSLRVQAPAKACGWTIRCHVSVAELGFVPGSLGLFNEMAMEGYPVVGIGACRGRISCDFEWFHPEGVDWRISAERCQGLIDRVLGARSFEPARRPVRRVPGPGTDMRSAA
jgi:hypothetical protein